MNSSTYRNKLPRVDSIVEFSKRLPGGVSREEAKSFLRRELRFPLEPDRHPPSIIEKLEKIDPKRVYFYRDDRQYGVISGVALRPLLKGHILLNERHCTYFFLNERLIPESWRCDGNDTPRFIFFWGSPDGDVWDGDLVPYLKFDHGWQRGYMPATERWYVNFHAATYDPEF